MPRQHIAGLYCYCAGTDETQCNFQGKVLMDLVTDGLGKLQSLGRNAHYLL